MPMDLEQFIRDVPDFPKPGIMFKDITPLLRHPAALRRAIDRLVAPYAAAPPDVLVAVEARGFLFAARRAVQLGCGVVPVRKPGKLPAATTRSPMSWNMAAMRWRSTVTRCGPAIAWS